MEPTPTRFSRILDGSTRVFAHHGLKRSQMADIARASGVALGTLYRYAESKETLFDLALRRGFTGAAPEDHGPLPVPHPRPEATLAFVREHALETEFFPRTLGVLDRPPPADAAREAAMVVEELYDVIDRNHAPIRIIDRSAREWPELADLFFRKVRAPLLERLGRYLRSRMDAGALRRAEHPETAARLLVETCAWFAMHRRYEVVPAVPAAITDEAARTTVLDFLRTYLSSPAPAAGRSRRRRAKGRTR